MFVSRKCPLTGCYFAPCYCMNKQSAVIIFEEIWPPTNVEMLYKLTTDASGHWGCGAFNEERWFQLQWPDSLEDSHISVKELIPIVVATAVWGRFWRGHADCTSLLRQFSGRCRNQQPNITGDCVGSLASLPVIHFGLPPMHPNWYPFAG